MDQAALKFDDMAEDHLLAYDYIKLHEANFFPTELNADKRTQDSCSNTIHYKELEKYYSFYKKEYTDKKCTNRNFGLLADKIEENAELFCQLESLIRKVRKDDVKNYDIKLLVNWFRCYKLRYADDNFIPEVWRCNTDAETKAGYYTFYMSENDPLCKLGMVAIQLECITIIACPNTAVVCHLFAKLCIDAGFECNLVFINPSSDKDKTEALQGCAGVITEQADLDSAVDTLLASTNWYPWKLKMLYIQESVFESVKKIFEWKCSTGDNHEKTVFKYDGKKFIFDYTADDTEGIKVEAYRTTKEVISIIAEKDPEFLSVWCNNNVEVNEICFADNINAPLVWVNDIGSFDGPLRSSEGYYSMLYSAFSPSVVKIDDIYTENLQKLRKSWLKQDILKRGKILIDILSKHDSKMAKGLIVITNKINCENKNFVQIDSGSIVIGECKSLILLAKSFSHALLESLIYDTMVIFDKNSSNDSDAKLAKLLAVNGLPIVFYDEMAKSKKSVRVKRGEAPFEMTRVIRQSFGTIFAN